MKKLFQNAAADVPASIVVFLVALPLCLGIALGSGAPLFAGIIAGSVGGIVIGLLSVMKKELGMDDGVVTTIAFCAFFLLTVSELGLLKLLLSSTRSKKISASEATKELAETQRLNAAAARSLNEAQPFDAAQKVGSVTENTTRSFEPAYRERE